MSLSHLKILYISAIPPLCIFFLASQAHANLFYYAEKGDIAKIQEAVEQGADVNAKGKDDWTPLMYASYEGHLDTVKYLVDKKADIHARNKDDWTALMYV